MLFNSLDFAIFLPIVYLLYWFVFNKNTDELVRLVPALQVASNSKDYLLAPVNWKVGDDLLVAGPPAEDEKQPTLLADNGFYNPVWFLCYKKWDMK